MDEPIITEPAPVEPPAPEPIHEPIPEPVAPAPQPGRRIDITVQAATDQALTVLLMTHGVLVAGEAGVRPADGVIHSHIGEAELDGLKLAGRYAFVSLDEGILGVERVASLLLDLDPHLYTGPAVRVLLGGSNFDPQAAVPQSVPMAEARRALLRSGMLGATAEAVDLAVRERIAALSEPARSEALIDWEFQPTVRRQSPLVLTLAQALGLTEAQVDALFVAAKAL